MKTRKTLVGALIVVMGLFLLSTAAVMAQPLDYCEGNFDNDYDVDGSDAYVFKTDFGRSSLLDPCPVIECQTAEELEIRIVQLETQLAQLTALLENVTRVIVDGHDTIQFSEVNVQIVDGSETTGDDVNGLGNLIVGYNELRGVGDDRTGSHNIVVGAFHNYSSYGGLVAGYGNNVSGGYSSVSGGSNNTSSGGNSSVSGGVGNIASDNYSSISGGASNTATGYSASVTGGRYNEASGAYSFVGGGGYESESHGNQAFGDYCAILGGRGNLAGDPDFIDHTLGQAATVSGGYQNIASGSHSSVSGGNTRILPVACCQREWWDRLILRVDNRPASVGGGII